MSDKTKLLLLGNSGVGKSHLLNVLLKEPVFQSGFSDAAVTQAIETRQCEGPDGRCFVLYNIPGLLDKDEAIAKRNAAEIERAFRERAAMPVIGFFVMTVEAGRVRPEDLEAWRAISDFVPALRDTAAVAFIINKVPFDEFATEAERERYEVNLRYGLRKHCGADFNIILLPLVAAAAREAFHLPAVADVRARLVEEMRRLAGKAMAAAENARVVLRDEQVRAETEKRNREAEQARQALEEQTRAQEAERARLQAEQSAIRTQIAQASQPPQQKKKKWYKKIF